MTNTRGLCGFCSREFSGSGMGNHLKKCPTRGEKLASIKPKAVPEIFHVRVSGRYCKDYWLHLEVQVESQLKDLDAFLRGIWLECCGHLSCFRINGQEYNVHPTAFGPGFGPRPQSMHIRSGKVLEAGMVLHYEYDFGSTTHLEVKVIERRPGCYPKQRVALIARNNPPVLECESCGKPATQACTECWYDYEAWFCDECILDHEAGEHEDMLLAVVNSPRMGVCGYTG